MQNGFIFIFFDRLILILKYCNLVELFKFVSRILAFTLRTDKTTAPSVEALRASSNIAIDVYQIFKWLVIIVLWHCGANGCLSLTFVIYLISANLFTYFHHQVWGTKYEQESSKEADNRRFLSTLLAIAYFLVAYAYLYQCHFSSIIKWANGPNAIDAFYISLSNAFTLPIKGFDPITRGARFLFASEVINTFLFFIIILSNAIPNHIQERKKEN